MPQSEVQCATTLAKQTSLRSSFTMRQHRFTRRQAHFVEKTRLCPEDKGVFFHGAGYGNRTRLRGLGSHYNSRYTNPASWSIIARLDGKCKQKCSTGFGRWGVLLRECREQLWLFRSRHFHCAESLGEKVTRYALRRKYSIDDRSYCGTVITVPYIALIKF